MNHARTDFQRAVMRRIQKDKVCPFCEEHFLKYHTKPIIKKGKYWLLTENFEPYKGAKHHLLAVLRRHVSDLADISIKEQVELFSIFTAELRRREIKGGTLLMRFGDTDYTGATVTHLHAQLVSGGKRGKKEPILTLVSYAY